MACTTDYPNCEDFIHIDTNLGLSDRPYWIDWLNQFFESILSIFV